MHLPSAFTPPHLLIAAPPQPNPPVPSLLTVNLSDLAHELQTLQREVARLRQQNAELMTLRQEVERLRREKEDLELTLHTITEHGDAIEEELRASNHQLQRVAEVDGLTQVSNRRKFDQYFAIQWRNMARIGHPLSLLLCDIDYFKQFNDFYGHLEGDDCLRRVAQTLAISINRSDDLLARYGGEEFVALLPNTGLLQAEIVAERMRQAILDEQIPHLKSELYHQVTLSIGVASWVPDPQGSPHQLLTQADRCLYRAKTQGRNRVISAC